MTSEMVTPDVNRVVMRKWILTLLGLNEASPIRGKMMITKQMFILSQEIVPDLAQITAFFPYQFGPYSTEVAKAFNSLLDDEFIETSQQRREWEFYISEKGKQEIKGFLEQLSDQAISELSSMKETTQLWGTEKLLDYIYTKHPEFIVNARHPERRKILADSRN